MDGHWEWSESGDEPDTGDTADLGGGHTDGAFEQGFGDGHAFGDTGFDGHDDYTALGDGHDSHGADDLEEPLGTEHAADDYDQSVHHETSETSHASDTSDAHFEDADGDPNQHAGFEPLADQHTEHAVDTDVDGGAEPFGSDPDLHGDTDGWPGHTFPEELHLDSPPEPVDGFPWTDADVLGGPDHTAAAFDPAVTADPASPADLAAYDGADVPAGADPWAPLLASDDPATSSLAGFWAPHT
ncbi:hypothetical protein ACQEVZ_42160 [Dactylosporangium sp. CA-152071]|uniref:hypothetical protein n=1 Tax=Dactylosporangium sp. CA-152071 TaxID=3239933 RepID=UPI003D8BFA1D